MISKKTLKKNEDKYLCFCSKVTHEKFENELISNLNTNLDSVCDKLDLAKQCAACLPNIEDAFFQIKGKRSKIKEFNFIKNTYSLKDKVRNFIDSLSGNKLVSQQGHLPMLVSKNIKTWLIISNEKPSILNSTISSYRIKLVIFDSLGNNIKEVNQLINPYEKFQVCLSNYIKKPKNSITTYYVNLKRSPTNKGFRGSIRPHFFYEAYNSMSAVHTQDGANKINFINVPVSKNKDKNLLFIINPSNKQASIETKLQSFLKGVLKKEKKEEPIIIPTKGSRLIEIINTTSYDKSLFLCKSSVSVKCYFIIADKNFRNISVDHI